MLGDNIQSAVFSRFNVCGIKSRFIYLNACHNGYNNGDMSFSVIDEWYTSVPRDVEHIQRMNMCLINICVVGNGLEDFDVHKPVDVVDESVLFFSKVVVANSIKNSAKRLNVCLTR